MKIPLWFLLVLLAGLFSPGRSDCQGECVACGLLLQQQQLQQAFNTMVCLLECEGRSSAPLTWQVCKQAVQLSEGGALLRRSGEELQLASVDLNSDGRLPRDERRVVQYDSSLPGSASEEEEGAEPLDEEGEGRPEGGEDDGSEGAVLSKRFGGFQRGRHGYRKLIGSPVRPLQKRYGGFIGVRKSARKWNSQKRVNQLLRQYLGMRSSRSGRLSPAPRLWRQDRL